MTEMHGRILSRKQRENYAFGIVTLFPALKDAFSPKGYEHFYDGESGTGYLKTTDVLKTFPRFLDIKGLVNQDFTLLFGPETSSKMLERWDSAFKPKIIQEARCLTPTPSVCHFLMSADQEPESDPGSYWDRDMATLLLLTHPLLPPPRGKKSAKISAADAAAKLVVYRKFCCSIDEALGQREGQQPYLLAVGRSQGRIDNFYIALDKKLSQHI
ncbi:hypothetical protein MATL_G00184640 [Megalops atlanticus]|uniref:Uncharacterized protein n=1 Tax=Megalops atlanticus TaxID=7932 RepID=A0A9D3T613_MEGAT|nr:hypothetical protein MATL_G00184640 [Megalops atlanticus]